MTKSVGMPNALALTEVGDRIQNGKKNLVRVLKGIAEIPSSTTLSGTTSPPTVHRAFRNRRKQIVLFVSLAPLVNEIQAGSTNHALVRRDIHVVIPFSTVQTGRTSPSIAKNVQTASLKRSASSKAVTTPSAISSTTEM